MAVLVNNYLFQPLSMYRPLHRYWPKLGAPFRWPFGRLLKSYSHLMHYLQEDRDRRRHQQGPGGRQERRVPARGTADASIAGAVRREERSSPTFRRLWQFDSRFASANLALIGRGRRRSFLSRPLFAEYVWLDALYNFHADHKIYLYNFRFIP